MSEPRPVMVDGVPRCNHECPGECEFDPICEPAIRARLKAAEEKVELMITMVDGYVCPPSCTADECDHDPRDCAACWRAWLERGE